MRIYGAWALALVLSVLTVMAAVTEVIVAAANLQTEHGAVAWSIVLSSAGTVAGGVAFAAVGTVLIFRYPRHRVAWIMTWLGLGWCTSILATDYGKYTLVLHPGALPAGEVAASFSVWTYMVNILLFFALVMFFPDGRVEGSWRYAVWRRCSLRPSGC